MLRNRSRLYLGSACLAVLTGLLVAGSGMASTGSSASAGALKVTTINVTAGKPSELAFKLSKFSNLPAGTFTFVVTDGGLGFHDFKICTSPTMSSAKNSCAGKATKILHPGQKATLTVTLTKKGTYEFLCSVPGHAAAGMKGLFGVGVVVKATATKPVTTTTATTTTTPASTTTTTVTPPPTTTTAGGTGCPGGISVQQNDQNSGSAGDRDEDDNGGADDNDGCL